MCRESRWLDDEAPALLARSFTEQRGALLCIRVRQLLPLEILSDLGCMSWQMEGGHAVWRWRVVHGEWDLTPGIAENWNVFEVFLNTNFRRPGAAASLRAAGQRDRGVPLHLHSS